ncbi:MAG: beta-ketoacyl-[acyl-carrier-protein] synthase family protein [Isosphaeraceae bacterium]
MLCSERRVVITGLGLISSLGDRPDRVLASLLEGRGAVRRLDSLRVAGLANDLAAEILGFELKNYALPKYRKALAKSKKYMARDIQLAVAAAQLALDDAGLADGGVDPTRIGIDLGAGLHSSELVDIAPAITHAYPNGRDFDFQTWGRESIGLIEPLWLLKYLPNMIACHISILFDCQGPSNTITEADASSNLAIGEAARVIARGKADVMITGGADSKMHPLSFVRMSMYKKMSCWKGEPSAACKPFDCRRDGLVPGEGAGILILEEREHALKRGACVHGEILGAGSGCDIMLAGGIDPEGNSTEVAITAALFEAGLAPAQVGHVNAHGASTEIADLAEARAIGRVFGPRGVPVTALKGYLGSLGAACGAVELVANLIGVNHGKIPAILNCDQPDPKCDADLVVDGPRPARKPIFVSTSLTNYGQAAAVVVRGGLTDSKRDI